MLPEIEGNIRAMRAKKRKKICHRAGPANDDGWPFDSALPADSYRALGVKIYEALTSLPVEKRVLLARATAEEMSGEQMRADPDLSDVLRRLRHPEGPMHVKRRGMRIVEN